MRIFLPILIFTVFCSCTGKETFSLPNAATQAPDVSELRLTTSAESGRQSHLSDEISYYMERHNPKDEGFDLVARYAAHGDSSMAVYLPPGRITLGSTLNPRRGKTLLRDRQGRLIIGCLAGDTLASGLRVDSSGFYAGQMNRHGDACGHGFYRDADGTYFEGHWQDNRREGFGMSIGPGHLKVGVWKNDLFRGEHVVHHSDRIYGIDISRYQHEKGRRRFPLHWKRLRIMSLGRRIQQSQVLDSLAYPVSFVYIKSTEGVTIENHYYDADDAAVRSLGLPVGAYHFLSTRTPADEQARHFLKSSRLLSGDLPPMLDIEPSDQMIDEMGGPLSLFNAIRQWLHIVEQATGCRPLLYVNQRFVNTYLHLAPDLKADYHFWIARYGEYKPDIHLDIWQLSGDGRVEGVVPECDINVFNGYQGQWNEFLQSQTIP